MSLDILQIPSNPLGRSLSIQTPLPENTSSFELTDAHKSYKHQFANIYFVRLRLLREYVERNAKIRWRGQSGAPPLVPRVLDVSESQLCIIIGTVYMDMPNKPNVMEDLGKDRSLPMPPEREKYYSSDDSIMLEDESGRIKLVGDVLRRAIDEVEDGKELENEQSVWGNILVTGVIMAALGHETSTGDFEVKDICFAGMAPMIYKDIEIPDSMDVDSDLQDDWIGIISGLEIGETSMSDIRVQLLAEYLAGEAGNLEDQADAARISRLIVAGNSLAHVNLHPEQHGSTVEIGSKAKRFGQETVHFSSVPTETLGGFLLDVAQLMPVHLLAGPSDPSGVLLPQQPLPRGMFGDVKKYDGFCCETNPTWLSIEHGQDDSSTGTKKLRSIFVHSGQSINDMFKYVPSPPTSRLDLACAALHWRHAAPTAPDTLWCYPYFTADPFILKGTPDLYVLGCQPEFGTRVVSSRDIDGDEEDDGEERKCRVVLVPSFKETGQLILVNMKTLAVQVVEFGVRSTGSTGST